MKIYSLVFLSILILSCISTNAQWIKTDGPEGGEISALATDGNRIFAGTQGSGIYLSTDQGNSWTAINNGLSGLNLNVISIAMLGDEVFIGCQLGLFESIDNGASWNEVNPLFTQRNVLGLNVIGSKIYVGIYGIGLSVSSDTGITWQQINHGLGFPYYIYSIAANDSFLFATDYNKGIYRTSIDSINWAPVNNGLTSLQQTTLATIGSDVFTGSWNGGVFITNNNGDLWTEINNGLPATNSDGLVVNGTDIYSISHSLGVYRSTNHGSSWSEVNNGFPFLNVGAFAVNGNNLFTGMRDGRGIYLSTNNGSSFNKRNSGLIATQINSLAVNGTTLFAGVRGEGVFFSNDQGDTWTSINNGLTDMNVNILVQKDSVLYAGTENGLFYSTTNGNLWIKNVNAPSCCIEDLSIYENKILAGTFYGCYISLDAGQSWSAVNTGLTDSMVYAVTIMGNKIFAGTRFHGLFVSVNNGSTWIPSDNGIEHTDTRALMVKGNVIFAGFYSDLSNPNASLYVSNDSGNTWEHTYFPGFSHVGILCMAQGDTNIFIGSGDVFSCSYDGTSWIGTPLNLQNPNVSSIIVKGTNLFAGTFGDGVYRNSTIITKSNELDKNNSELFVSPNPANDKFIIRTNSPIGNAELKIFNLNGDEMYTEKIKGGSGIFTKEISPKLPSGIFLVRIKEKEKQYSGKLVIEK